MTTSVPTRRVRLCSEWDSVGVGGGHRVTPPSLVFLGTLRLAQDYVVFPRLVRRGIHMHPLGVILAILSGAELAGIAGIFLAIAVVAVLSVIHRHLLEYRGSAGLVSELLTHSQSIAAAGRTTSAAAVTPIASAPADTQPALEPRRTAITP